MATFKATLHHYNFPSAKHPGYIAMCAKIKANSEGRGHWMNSWGGDRHDSSKDNTTEVVEIETAHVFGNQWNTADGRRVFDWYQEYTLDSYVRGHWLEITPELVELRRVTLTCGYCGKHYGPHHSPAPATPFCTACLDSPHLKAEDLKLLRLCPVLEASASNQGRADLTEEERAELMPRYVEQQTVATSSRAKKHRDRQRADILATFEKVTKAATEERDGLLWLWDHGVNLDNVIYYSHTEVFSFGWRSPVSQEVKSKLLDLLSEFPFQYEIKPASGSTLTNAWKK